MRDLKRHIISFVITFASAFITVVLPFLSELSLENVDALQAVILAGIFAGIRAVVKALNEFLIKKDAK